MGLFPDEDVLTKETEAKELLGVYSASCSLTPSYIFNQDIERRIEDLSAMASRTLTKQEIQHRNIEKTLELQRRIIED
jgi:hypothetical protein